MPRYLVSPDQLPQQTAAVVDDDAGAWLIGQQNLLRASWADEGFLLADGYGAGDEGAVGIGLEETYDLPRRRYREERFRTIRMYAPEELPVASGITMSGSVLVGIGVSGTVAAQIGVDGSLPLPIVANGVGSILVQGTGLLAVGVGASGDASVRVQADSNSPLSLGVTGTIAVLIGVAGSIPITVTALGDAGVVVGAAATISIPVGVTGTLAVQIQAIGTLLVNLGVIGTGIVVDTPGTAGREPVKIIIQQSYASLELE